MKNGQCISANVQARIMTPPIPLVKLEIYEDLSTHIIKVKNWINLTSTMLDTYKINMSTLNYGQPEEFLAILNNFRVAIYRTGTTSLLGQINYLCMMLHGDDLRELD